MAIEPKHSPGYKRAAAKICSRTIARRRTMGASQDDFELTPGTETQKQPAIQSDPN